MVFTLPEWRGNLFVGALAGQALWRPGLHGTSAVWREPC
jgi:aldose sugar dehydrogenase